MRKSTTVFALVVALGSASVVSAGERDPVKSAIRAREAAFTLFAANIGPMGAMAKNEIPFDKGKFALRATNLEALSKMPWEFFIPGSQKGSKANSAVWEKSDDFKTKAEIFQEKVTDLAKATENGDQDAMKKRFREVASACKACRKFLGLLCNPCWSS